VVSEETAPVVPDPGQQTVSEPTASDPETVIAALPTPPQPDDRISIEPEQRAGDEPPAPSPAQKAVAAIERGGWVDPVDEKAATRPADPAEEKTASLPAEPLQERAASPTEPVEGKASAPADPVEASVAPDPDPSAAPPTSESSTASIGPAAGGEIATPSDPVLQHSEAVYRRRYRRPGQTAAPEDAPQEDPNGTGLREYSAREFALDYLDAWSSDNEVAERSVTHFYGATVQFHGRPIGREKLLAEKRRFMQRWPRRDYVHRADSLVVQCDAGADVCSVRSTYDYKIAGRSGRRGQGTEALDLWVGFANEQPFILYENSVPLPRDETARGSARSKAAAAEVPAGIESPPPRPPARPDAARPREPAPAGKPDAPARRLTADADARTATARRDRADEPVRPAPRRPVRQGRPAPVEAGTAAVDLPRRLLPRWDADGF
jgi:hypothetical protein